jgi:hypothetical protein
VAAISPLSDKTTAVTCRMCGEQVFDRATHARQHTQAALIKQRAADAHSKLSMRCAHCDEFTAHTVDELNTHLAQCISADGMS